MHSIINLFLSAKVFVCTWSLGKDEEMNEWTNEKREKMTAPAFKVRIRVTFHFSTHAFLSQFGSTFLCQYNSANDRGDLVWHPPAPAVRGHWRIPMCNENTQSFYTRTQSNYDITLPTVDIFRLLPTKCFLFAFLVWKILQRKVWKTGRLPHKGKQLDEKEENLTTGEHAAPKLTTGMEEGDGHHFLLRGTAQLCCTQLMLSGY